MDKKYHIRRREFLNLNPELRAYIIAVVEDAREKHVCCKDDDEWHHIVLRLADCSEEIEFYFDLNTIEQRENSLHKIRTLAEVIDEFKRALELELAVINARDVFPQNSRAAAAVH